eukprot:gene13151-15158_t
MTSIGVMMSQNGNNYGSLSTVDVDAKKRSKIGALPMVNEMDSGNESDLESHGTHRSVAVPGHDEPWLKNFFAYAGPGALVAVGYMDPGNWSSDIGGGSAYNYDLLFVVLWASLIALFFQILSVKLAIATGKDLAQASKVRYSEKMNYVLWLVAETAIMATDLAEVLGSAIALKLLFGLRLEIGVMVTAIDVVIVFAMQGSQIQMIEVLVILLIVIIIGCFGVQLFLSQPQIEPLLQGMFVPKVDMLTNPQKLFMSISILGATIMPHSLFLHSSMVLTRSHPLTMRGKKEALSFAVLDCTVSLSMAFFVNASILIVAAAAFYKHGYHEVADLIEANKLLDPLLGSQFASIAFAIALLASGLNSTLTGTMAGQVVMEGFIDWTLDPFYRRILTRAAAIVPAMLVIIIGGDGASNDLLLFSQVILSFALPFAVVPLVQLTADDKVMGEEFVNSQATTGVSYLFAGLISLLNVLLVVFAVTGNS